MTDPIRLERPLARAFETVAEVPLLRKDVPSFGDVLRKVLQDASQLQSDAQETIEAFLRGDPVELHQMMAAAEESAISLELLVEIRNKLTEAYRTVMNMQ